MSDSSGVHERSSALVVSSYNLMAESWLAVKSNQSYSLPSTGIKLMSLLKAADLTEHLVSHQTLPSPGMFCYGATKEDALPSPPMKEASHPSYPPKISDQQYPESQLKHSTLAASLNQTAGCIWKV